MAHLDNPISIHALREESDWTFIVYPDSAPEFQSTLSVRRATFVSCERHSTGTISIHALREESDNLSQAQLIVSQRISIHALREESDRT